MPNEYPGHIYAFNWCLNGDGVTPVNKAAFRITKPLDLKVAGIAVPKKNPLQVRFVVVDKKWRVLNLLHKLFFSSTLCLELLLTFFLLYRVFF